MKRLFPLAVVVALAVGCGSSHRCPRGAEIVLRAVPQQRGQTINGTQMHAAQQIMADRVDGIGVSSPKVTLRGDDEIVIRYAGVHSPAKAAAIVGSTGKLQFFDFEKDLAAPTVSNGNPTPYPTLYSLLTAVKGDAAKGTPEKYYLFCTQAKVAHPLLKCRRAAKKKIQNPALAGPASTTDQLLAGFPGHKKPPGTTILGVPAHREV